MQWVQLPLMGAQSFQGLGGVGGAGGAGGTGGVGGAGGVGEGGPMPNTYSSGGSVHPLQGWVDYTSVMTPGHMLAICEGSPPYGDEHMPCDQPVYW